MFIHYTVLKILNVCILEIKFARLAGANILMPGKDLPLEFRPKLDTYLAGTASTGGIKMDYHWLKLTPQGKFYTFNNAGVNDKNLQTTIAYITVN